MGPFPEFCEICGEPGGATYDVHKILQHPPKWIPPVETKKKGKKKK